jgi:CBS domain-containing protein
MKTAAQILISKIDQTVHTMGPNASAYEAVRLMADKNIGALVVVERDQVVGIVSERDYARRIVLMARSSKDTLLGDIMSSPVLYVHPDQTIVECMALMTENRLRHLPVMAGGRLIGLISIGDLVKATIADQQFTIEQLEHYISGQP